MKLLSGLSCALALGLAVHEASALPSPKSSWVRHRGKGRKAMADQLNGKTRVRRAGDSSDTDAATCNTTTAAPAITAPKSNIWSSLTEAEAASVVAYLFAQPELNLTTSEEAGEWDNTLLLVEALFPNKTDATAYLDGNAAAPVRWVHAVLDNRAMVNATYQDLLVGPLPLDNATVSWQPLTFPYNKASNDGAVRNLDANDESLYTDWLYPIAASIADITLDLWNGTVMGLDNDTLDVWGIDPLWQEDGRIIRWDTFWMDTTGEMDTGTLLPLGLFFQSDVTGRDPSTWTLEGWLYNDVFYPTTEAFRAAYWSRCFEKLPPNVDGTWGGTNQDGPVEPLDAQYPPTPLAPAGTRFKVDTDAQYVEWMGFSFYISFRRDTGMALHDIRYQGERILFELGLQEALAHYAGNDPVQSGTAYLDSYYGFGPYAFELVPGYDCPAYATMLNSSFYVSETTHTHVNSICLFEYTADYPIQRHSTSEYVSVTKNTYFAVRSVSTVGNYDYAFTYSFFRDGSIAVEVRASGYIQGAYYAHNGDYGFHIHDALSGSMHDHVLNFKADFDILGTANSVQLMHQVPVTQSYPWSGGKTHNTMQLQREFVVSEDTGRFNWDQNAATQVLVVNQNATNAYGELRGYRVLPYTGSAHLTVQNSTNLANAARWAEYDIQVTRQKDTEPRSAYAYNTQDVHDPPVDFGKFFDGESLLQEDLVVWLNLGMHHVPHTGDIPNTVTTTAHSGIQFMPSNYFARDLSRTTVQQVRIDYGDGNVTAVETFGQEDESCALDFEPTEVDLWDYTGDVVIRKFPFDPNNPYYETDSIE